MKNYLGNLIARHLNQAEVLEPRLASQFEPQSSVFQAETLEPQTSTDEVATPPETASRDFETVATEFPVATDVDRPVTREPVQPPRSKEKFLESSVPEAVPPTLPVSQQVKSAERSLPVKSELPISVVEPPAELKEPAFVLAPQREKTIEQTSSDVQPTQRAEVREAPVVETDVRPLLVAPAPKTVTQTKVEPVAETVVTETVEERGTVASDPPRPTTKHSALPRLSRSMQILTPSSPIDLPSPIPASATESATEHEVPIRVSRRIVHTVGAPEDRRDTEALAEVEQPSPLVLPSVPVIPTPTAPKLPAIDSAEKQIQVSPAQPKQTTQEIRPPHQTQRAPFFETREMNAAQNQPLSIRQKFSSEANTAVEVGPTVNVTIGRIEVRAAAQIPEAQPQKQQREHQVLSLDEYLSQRSAGGR